MQRYTVINWGTNNIFTFSPHPLFFNLHPALLLDIYETVMCSLIMHFVWCFLIGSYMGIKSFIHYLSIDTEVLLHWYWWILARVGCKTARACECILNPTSANVHKYQLSNPFIIWLKHFLLILTRFCFKF